MPAHLSANSGASASRTSRAPNPPFDAPFAGSRGGLSTFERSSGGFHSRRHRARTRSPHLRTSHTHTVARTSVRIIHLRLCPKSPIMDALWDVLCQPPRANSFRGLAAGRAEQPETRVAAKLAAASRSRAGRRAAPVGCVNAQRPSARAKPAVALGSAACYVALPG